MFDASEFANAPTTADLGNLTVESLLADPVRNPSFFTVAYTTPFSKIMCSTSAYAFHIILAYLVSIAGAGAVITRAVPAWKHLHKHFGRAFLVRACTFVCLYVCVYLFVFVCFESAWRVGRSPSVRGSVVFYRLRVSILYYFFFSVENRMKVTNSFVTLRERSADKRLC